MIHNSIVTSNCPAIDSMEPKACTSLEPNKRVDKYLSLHRSRKPFVAAINYSELNLTNAIKLASESGEEFSEKA